MYLSFIKNDLWTSRVIILKTISNSPRSSPDILVTSDELRGIELDSWFHIRLFVSQGETFQHTIGTTSKTSPFFKKTKESCGPLPNKWNMWTATCHSTHHWVWSSLQKLTSQVGFKRLERTECLNDWGKSMLQRGKTSSWVTQPGKIWQYNGLLC